MAGGLEFRNGRRARKESQSLELSLAGPAPGCVRPRTHTANELLTKPPASRTVALRGFPPCSLSPQGVSRQPATPRALLVVRDDESDVREPLQKKIRAGCAGPQIFVASGGLHIIGGMAYSLLALREKREHGLRTILGVCCVAALVGCAQSSVAPTFPSSVTQTQSSRAGQTAGATRGLSTIRALSKRLSSKIQHVVIIIQENRTTNDLFNGLPGADTVRTAKNSTGQIVHLRPEPLTEPYDISHLHADFETEYANGRLDGFNLVVSYCNKGATCPPPMCARTAMCRSRKCGHISSWPSVIRLQAGCSRRTKDRVFLRINTC